MDTTQKKNKESGVGGRCRVVLEKPLPLNGPAEIESEGELSSAGKRTRSRSRSSDRLGDFVKSETKKQAKARRRAEKEKAEKEREKKLEEEREKERVLAEKAREERDRKKREEAEASYGDRKRKSRVIVSDESECDVTGKRRSMSGDACVISELRAVTRDLRGLLLSEPNKVSKYVVNEVMGQASRYESIIERLMCENARLRGKVEAYEGIAENVRKIECSVNEVCEKVEKSVCVRENMGERMNEVRKSYAVVVRGAKEDLTTADVRKRMLEEVGNVSVRVQAVKPVKGGGLVVEVPTERERKALVESKSFRDAGLRLEQPKRLDPRVVVYDVPNRMTDEHLLNGVFEKGLSGVLQREDFAKRVRVVRRISRDGKELGNVIVELPAVCRDVLLREGRVYVGWSSFKVASWETVLRCFKCMGYGHRAKECKREVLCMKCGKSGHKAAACSAPEDCPNCRARKQPSGHRATSSACPEYEWRLRMWRARMNNG